MNIIAKHDGQAMVASRELQYWHAGASVELAAPQFGQFSVSACIRSILAGGSKVDYELNAVRCFPRSATLRVAVLWDRLSRLSHVQKNDRNVTQTASLRIAWLSAWW
ncbi:MAG: hypothetical protein M3R52_12265 [Acidobacteriota bacterium]|nr:hypothetical protein [Acidobacteriota bacterium]